MSEATSQSNTPFSTDPSQLFRRHIHDGIETEKLDYNNLKNTPTAYTPPTNSAVSAFRGSTTQSISASTEVKVAYDNEVFDLNSEFDTSANSFQPTQAGYYLIHAQIEWASPPGGRGATRYIRLYKSGSAYLSRKANMDNYDSATPMQSITDIIHLNGGSEYITVYCYQDAGGAININNDTSYFTAALLMKD